MDPGSQVSGTTGAADDDADLNSYNIVPVILGELAQLREFYQLSGEQANALTSSDSHVRTSNSGAVLLLRCSDEAFDMVIRSLDGQDIRLALMLLQRQVDLEEQTQGSLSNLAKLYRQTSMEKFLATAQQLMASQQRLASVRSRILRCVSKQIANASDGQVEASVQPLIDRVLRYPELSTGYMPSENRESTIDLSINSPTKPITKSDTTNNDHEHINSLQAPPDNRGAESDEDMFESFAGPSVTLSPLVGMLMQRMAEERSPLIDTGAKVELRRVRSEERPERPKTPSPPGETDDEDQGPLSPFVGNLLGKSFPQMVEEEEAATCQTEEVVMAVDSSLAPPPSEGTVTPREKKQTTEDGTEPPEPPRRTSSYDILRRHPSSPTKERASPQLRSDVGTHMQSDERHDSTALSPTSPTSPQSSAFSSPFQQQSESPTRTPVPSPTSSFSNTLDRKRHFTGNVTDLLCKMTFPTSDDQVDGTSTTDNSVQTHSSQTSPGTERAQTSPNVRKTNTAPGSRETLLATATAGLRKERATLPDVFDADLTALLKITEHS